MEHTLVLKNEDIREIQTLLFTEAEISYDRHPMPEQTKKVIRIYQEVLRQSGVHSEDIKEGDEDWVALEPVQ